MKKIFLSFCMLLVLPMTAEAALPKDATMSWTAPATNTDGSPLEDLAGYRVHCGKTTGSYTITQDVGNVLEYKVSDTLPTDGVYFCVATAYDTSGNESAYSNEVTFPLNRLAPAPPAGVRVR